MDLATGYVQFDPLADGGTYTIPLIEKATITLSVPEELEFVSAESLWGGTRGKRPGKRKKNLDVHAWGI